MFGVRHTDWQFPGHWQYRASASGCELPEVQKDVSPAGARLLAFLSGPANYGRGAVVRLTEVRPESEDDTEEEEDLPLYDPSFPDINPYSFPSRRRQQRPANNLPNGHHMEFAVRADEGLSSIDKI